MSPLTKFSAINKENDPRPKNFYYRDRHNIERLKQNGASLDDLDILKPKEPFYDVPINQSLDKAAPGKAGRTMSFSFPTTAQMNLKVDWPYHGGSGTAEETLSLPHQNNDYKLHKPRDRLNDFKGSKPVDRFGPSYYRRHSSYTGHNSPSASVISGQQVLAYPVGSLSSHASFNSSTSSNKENIIPKKHG